jgi:nucleotide-binding universal stress UspA family protein
MSYRIVVGVDGSENSTRALAWSVEEARLREGFVTAVFAWQFPMIGVPGAFEREQLEQQAKALISHHVASVAGEGNVQVEAVIANGEAGASLVAACEHADADLLVVGSNGRDRLGGLLVGSIEQQCIAYAPCPVLIVKDKLQATA